MGSTGLHWEIFQINARFRSDHKLTIFDNYTFVCNCPWVIPEALLLPLYHRLNDDNRN